MENTKPIASTYVHVQSDTPITHAIDASAFGVSASIRLGSHGENDVALFLRSPEQLERLADEAKRAAAGMRRALALQAQLAASAE